MLSALNCLNITMQWGIQCKWLEKLFHSEKKKTETKQIEKNGTTWLATLAVAASNYFSISFAIILEQQQRKQQQYVSETETENEPKTQNSTLRLKLWVRVASVSVCVCCSGSIKSNINK